MKKNMNEGNESRKTKDDAAPPCEPVDYESRDTRNVVYEVVYAVIEVE